MKTLPVNIANTTSQMRARIQSFMAIAGIITAIICSLVLLQDAYASERTEAGAFDIIKTPKSAITDQVVKTKNVLVLSAIRSLK